MEYQFKQLDSIKVLSVSNLMFDFENRRLLRRN